VHEKQAISFKPIASIGKKFLKGVGYGKDPKKMGWLRKQLFRQAEGVALPTAKKTKYLQPGERTLLEGAGKFARHPIAEIKKALGTGPTAMGLGEKALFGGMTALHLPQVATAEPGDRGRQIGQLAGSTAGWMAFRKMPMIASRLGWAAGEGLGGLGGKGVSRLVAGHKAVPRGRAGDGRIKDLT
jgi:hypothetical protein